MRRPMGQPWCCPARHVLGLLLVLSLAQSSHSASNETTAAPTAITSTPAPAPAGVGGKPRKVATPVFTPSGAQPYVLSVSITISCATEGVSIRYTTDGSVPSGNRGMPLGDDGKVIWDSLGRTVFTAVASMEGWEDSDPAEASYLVIDRAARPRFEGVEEGGVYISSANITVKSVTPGSTIHYTTEEGSSPSSSSLAVPNGGVITWDRTGTTVIRAIAVKQGLAPSQVASLTITIIGQVSPPRFEPDRDGFVLSATLSVHCDTPGAIVLYTWDGSTPTGESAMAAHAGETIFWGHTGEVTLKAIATREGMADSRMVSKTLHVLEQVSPPRFVVFGEPFDRPDDSHATYIRTANLTILCDTPNVTVYYVAGYGLPRPGASNTLELPHPGYNLTWADALGETHFKAMARAPHMADSEVTHLYLTLIRELYVEYPMHHVEYTFEVDEDTNQVVVVQQEHSPVVEPPEDETAASNTTATTATSAGLGIDHNADDDVVVEDDDKGLQDVGEGPDRLELDEDEEAPHKKKKKGKKKKHQQDEDEEEKRPSATANATAGSHASSEAWPSSPDVVPTPPLPQRPGNGWSAGGLNVTVAGNGTLEEAGWRPVNGSNSSYVQPLPHTRYRRPFNVEGYEGVQPVVSMHVVEAQFKDCSFCTARRVRGRFVTLDNPSRHFSLLQQLQGCSHGAELPSVTGRAYLLPDRPVKYVPAGFNRTLLQRLNRMADQQYQDVKDLGCQIVTNAGFFNTTSFDCFGNLVSRGEVIRTTTHHSTSFGMRNGSFVIGYLTPEQIRDTTNPFQELISGILWLVRDGQSYVEESLKEEYMGFQETGAQFTTVKSARTALGHDRQGRLVLLQMEGETWSNGVDLYELADLLVELGVVNAINLDGGGSATLTQNHSLVSDPSWLCEDDNPKSLFRCEKAVASITCIHAAPPPVFLPMESTWANYTNITRAEAQAAQDAALRAAINERAHLCAGYCPSPRLPSALNASKANGTTAVSETPWAWGTGGARGDGGHGYKASTAVLGGCLLVSLLIHLHTCWAKGSVRLRRRPLRGGGVPMSLGGGKRGSWSIRELGGVGGPNGRRSHGSSGGGGSGNGFQRVRLGEDDDGDEEEEVEIDAYELTHQGGRGGGGPRLSLVSNLWGGWSGGARRAHHGPSQGGGGGYEGGVREVELELNPFLSGAFPASHQPSPL